LVPTTRESLGGEGRRDRSKNEKKFPKKKEKLKGLTKGEKSPNKSSQEGGGKEKRGGGRVWAGLLKDQHRGEKNRD